MSCMDVVRLIPDVSVAPAEVIVLLESVNAAACPDPCTPGSGVYCICPAVSRVIVPKACLGITSGIQGWGTATGDTYNVVVPSVAQQVPSFSAHRVTAVKRV